MLKEVYKNIWLIEVPLPKSPLRSLNAYLIKGKEGHLLIDTGFNCLESEEVLLTSLKKIGVDRGEVDIFLTHPHSDHAGLAGRIVQGERLIYCSRKTQRTVNSLTDLGRWKEIFTEAPRLGFEDELSHYLEVHPGFRYGNSSVIEAASVEEGHVFRIGDYTFEVLSTPGHDPGMLCLYEREEKLLFSGDHILGKITPNISCWSLETNPLQDYFESLRKTKGLALKRTFPSHRSIIEGGSERIEELEEHSLERLIEVEEVLRRYGEQTPYEVASKLKWKIPEKNWSDVNPVQKWFATGEAMANLTFLYHQGRAALVPGDNYLFKLI